MSAIRTLRCLIDDEQRNCEYLAELRLEQVDETEDFDEDQLPMLIDLRLLETRQLDEHGDVANCDRNPGDSQRVAELLEEPGILQAALDNQMTSDPTDHGEPATRREATSGRLRDLLARGRTADRRRQPHSERDAG